MLAEQHKLGLLDHTKYIPADPDLEKAYRQKCIFFESVINHPDKFGGLCRLKISKTGFNTSLWPRSLFCCWHLLKHCATSRRLPEKACQRLSNRHADDLRSVLFAARYHEGGFSLVQQCAQKQCIEEIVTRGILVDNIAVGGEGAAIGVLHRTAVKH
jgi:hypothetical protein